MLIRLAPYMRSAKAEYAATVIQYCALRECGDSAMLHGNCAYPRMQMRRLPNSVTVAFKEFGVRDLRTTVG